MANSIAKKFERINLFIEEKAESLLKIMITPLYFLFSIAIVMVLAYFDPFSIHQNSYNYGVLAVDYGIASFIIHLGVGFLLFLIATWNVVEE